MAETTHISKRSGILATPAAVLFTASLPFTFYPRVLDGDTQPWALLATLLLFTLSHTAQRFRNRDLIITAAVIGGVLMFFSRAGIDEETLRFTYKMLAFLFLWLVVPTLPSNLVSQGLKTVIVIWFFAGLLQVLIVELGITSEFSGRFVYGRSGVPSLTPEPSLFGMLSLLAYFILLSGRKETSWIYGVLVIGNVIMSGSILAILLTTLIFFMINWRLRILAIVLVIPTAVYVLSTSEFSALNRFQTFLESELSWRLLLLDNSFNLRAGHYIYTMWVSLPDALLMKTSPNFMTSYNTWATQTQYFNITESNFILTGLGRVIYRGGPFGIFILFMLLLRAWQSTNDRKLIKLAVLIFLLTAQLDISNAFIILYALQAEHGRNFK